MQNIKIRPKHPLDAVWYQRLLDSTKNIAEAFIMLEPSQRQLTSEREKFAASDCKRNPNLRPLDLDEAWLDDALDMLAALRDDITHQESDQYIREAYLGHIGDRIANIEMIRAAATGNHDEYIEKNIELYGMPDSDVFAASCAWLRHDLQNTNIPAGTDLANIRDKALRLLPEVQGDHRVLIPDDDIFKKVRDMHFTAGGFFDQLFAPAGLPDRPYIEQDFGDTLTEQAISNVGSDYTIKTAVDGLWAVLSSSRQVVRPLGYRVDRDYFVGVIAHEVGSHLLEESNGSNQPLQLLRLGLSGFEKGNEGRAYLREQIVYQNESVFLRQSSWEYILMLHLSVSLASGLHGGRAYTFVELYECLYALHRFFRERRYPFDTINDVAARDEAWLLAVRIMKGTNGTGGCYMKDTVYLQGNITCWKIAKSHGPEVLLLGDIGKFNIGDSSHFDILYGLSILPLSDE